MSWRRRLAAVLVVIQLAPAGCASRRQFVLRPDSSPEYISDLNARFGGRETSVALDDGTVVAGQWFWVEGDSILLASEQSTRPIGFAPARVRALQVHDRQGAARAALARGAFAGGIVGLPLGWWLAGVGTGGDDDPSNWERVRGALVGASVFSALVGLPAMLLGGAAGREVRIYPRGYGSAEADTAGAVPRTRPELPSTR